MIMLLNLFGNFFKKNNQININMEEVLNLGLTKDELVLVYSDFDGAKLWKCAINSLKGDSFTVVPSELKMLSLPLDEGQDVQIGVFRKNKLVLLRCRLLKNNKKVKPPKLVFCYPYEIKHKPIQPRKHARVNINMPAKLRIDIEGKNWIKGIVKDISRSGLCFLSPENVNRLMSVRVKLLTGDFPFELKGSITRVIQIEKQVRKGALNYNIGVKFDNLNINVDEKLCDYLWKVKYGSKGTKRRR